MELADKLRAIMEKEFGIKTDADLIEAAENYPGIDLGIFVTPFREEEVTRVINAEEKSKEGTAERNGIYEIMVD